MSKKSNMIESLTSLRFFAAFGVFLHHLGLLGSSSIPSVHLASRYFFNGYTGVTFFYILSGFIINYSFKRHIEVGKFDRKDFIVFRVCRLFPVHILSLTVVLFLFGYLSQFGLVNKIALIANFSLINAFIPDPGYYFSFNPVSWSISCEIFFYIAFCFFVNLKSSRLVILLLIIQSINIYFISSPPSKVPDHWMFYVNPIFRLSDFIIGVLLCRVFIGTNFNPGLVSGTIIECSSIALVFATVYVSTNYIANMNIRYDILFIPCMAFLVMAFTYNSGLISKILKNKMFIFLGEASFSFYMIHWMVIAKLYEMMNPSPNNMVQILTYAAASFSISIFCSVIVFNFYEKPVNNFIRKTWIRYRYGVINEKMPVKSTDTEAIIIK